MVEAIQRAIDQVVAEFQQHPHKLWNERYLHWSPFHYIKQQGVVSEAYYTQLIRAKFPTQKIFSKRRPAREHYDMVILDSDPYLIPEVQYMERKGNLGDFLNSIRLKIAIEIELWEARLKQDKVEQIIKWNKDKLTKLPNNIMTALFLNFVKMNFNKEQNYKYYQDLREHLSLIKEQYPELKILCVHGDHMFQPDPE